MPSCGRCGTRDRSPRSNTPGRAGRASPQARRLYKDIREPYFFGYVRDQLIRKYGAEKVRSGGLSVYTTIVPRWQKAAQEAIKER